MTDSPLSPSSPETDRVAPPTGSTEGPSGGSAVPSEKLGSLGRRGFLSLAALGATALALPHIWVPRSAAAQTAANGAIKHLIYIRLSGGFRFPTAFNADVGGQFNPFGLASGVPEGTQWGVSKLLERAPFLSEEGIADSGMRRVSELANRITVMPTVDHEPLAGGADGNHETGLERYLTGYVNGEAGFFTRIQLGLKKRYADALTEGKLILPPFVMGASSMGRGLGEFAPHRPPVLNGASFDRFTSSGGTVPDWAQAVVRDTDLRMRDRQHPALRERVEAYLQTREATKKYAEIFASEQLKIENDSEEDFDGISNKTLKDLFGDSGESSNVRLGLRLFHYGCPAVYLDQGGYDYHSGEADSLPEAMERLNRIISALIAVLPKMRHPDGGSYWDHTVVVLGSEFSRTARGGGFNSARGSDHGSDYATRWMSMPFFGGPIVGGRIVGASTAKEDLAPDGTVYSYRAVLNTLMDGLGCEPGSPAYFPGDILVPGLIGAI